MLKILRVGFRFIKTFAQMIDTKRKDIKKTILNRKNARKRYKMAKNQPPPPLFKQKIVKRYANKFSINLFVETGTYMGAMVNATRDVFDKVFSIELDDDLYKSAKEMFSKYNHISIMHGDSSKILPSILSKINLPCLFWLDAHYSGGITAKGELETPILLELKHILNSSEFNHVILIDDARCFIGLNDYPTLNELKNLISKMRQNYSFIVKEDIIRIHKKI